MAQHDLTFADESIPFGHETEADDSSMDAPTNNDQTESLLTDDMIHLVLQFVGFEYRNNYDYRGIEFNIKIDLIDNPATRQRFFVYFKFKYLPSLFRKECRNNNHDGYKIFSFIIPHNTRYYFSAGTAGRVGSFGNIDVFMDYFTSSDHAYAPAGVLGAVSSGRVQMLEMLATFYKEDFRFIEIADMEFDEEQLSIGYSDFPTELLGYSSFHCFLYAAIEFRELHSLEWLLNWASSYDGSASYALAALSKAVDIWHTQSSSNHKFECMDPLLNEQGEREIDDYATDILDRFGVWNSFQSPTGPMY